MPDVPEDLLVVRSFSLVISLILACERAVVHLQQNARTNKIQNSENRTTPIRPKLFQHQLPPNSLLGNLGRSANGRRTSTAQEFCPCWGPVWGLRIQSSKLLH